MTSIRILNLITQAIKGGRNATDCPCGGKIEIQVKDGKLAAAKCNKCGWKLIV